MVILVTIFYFAYYSHCFCILFMLGYNYRYYIRGEIQMIKKLIDCYKNFEKITCKILKHGLKFCFILCLFSILMLLTYDSLLTTPILYHIGLSLFRLSIIFGIEFLICAFVVDGIKKQTI